ncbi:hypothetical protein CK203_032798 [Vitis vinifera]|uniref:Uncharacterized protein n=1 Tax=Vitis vinifera TaxID=29760 RepID=A0A438I8E2_VITVI|nr:hypothetical protein CK203_032798 [Vitis vinifera]
MVIPLSPKKPCSKILYLEPVLVIVPTLEPSAATAGTNPTPDKRSFSAGGGIRPELGGPPLVRLNSMMTPLKREAPMNNMGVLFSATRRVSVVANVCNLMQHRAMLFKRLEATKTMRVYIAHNMDDNEELRAKLKSVEDEFTVARKVVDEGVKLLRKTEKRKETAKAESRWLTEE